MPKDRGDRAVMGDPAVMGDRNGQGGDPAVIGGVTEMVSGGDSAVTQIENKREERKEKCNRDSAALKFPWHTDEFIEAWRSWTEFRLDQFKFKYKTVESEQLALHKLHKDSHGRQEVAIDAIAESIAGGYRGLHPKPHGKGQQPGKSNSWARAIREKYQRNPDYNA